MSTLYDKNPANLFTGDFLAILSSSDHMTEALRSCPQDQAQKMFDSFNSLMWQMNEAALKSVSEAVRRRSLREIQVGDKVHIAVGPRVEVKEGTNPRIFRENGRYKAEVETPTGKTFIEFEEKR